MSGNGSTELFLIKDDSSCAKLTAGVEPGTTVEYAVDSDCTLLVCNNKVADRLTMSQLSQALKPENDAERALQILHNELAGAGVSNETMIMARLTEETEVDDSEVDETVVEATVAYNDEPASMRPQDEPGLQWRPTGNSTLWSPLNMAIWLVIAGVAFAGGYLAANGIANRKYEASQAELSRCRSMLNEAIAGRDEAISQRDEILALTTDSIATATEHTDSLTPSDSTASKPSLR